MVLKLFVWVGDKAERRQKDRFLWEFLAQLVNPITAMVGLWLFLQGERPGVR